MSVTYIGYFNGRLCNQIFRNVALNIIAKKFNLFVNYYNYDIINNILGIKLFCGEEKFSKYIILNDDNYFDILNLSNINFNLDASHNFFQTVEISKLIYSYLNSIDIKSNIITNNKFKDRYNSNNDLYIHIRLTDAAQYNPGLDYYINTIKIINYDKLYISTDERNHEFIKKIQELYPNLILIDYDEIDTIQFASTCKYIILSHGSYSAIIGYLSFYSTIYYPEYNYNKIWCGNMFSIDGWNKINYL